MPKRTRTPSIEREREIQRAARRLKGKLLAFSRKSLSDVFEMGDLLNEAAALLKGGFSTWVAGECGFEPRTAFNYRRLAARLGPRRSEMISHGISPTAAVHLGGADPATVERVLERARAGLPVSVEFVRETIRRERSGRRERNAMDEALLAFRREAKAHWARLAGEFIASAQEFVAAPRHRSTSSLRQAAGRTLLARLDELVGTEAAEKSALGQLITCAAEGSGLAAAPRNHETQAPQRPTRVLEICAGGGGSALGFEAAGYEHVALVDKDPDCCGTLRLNRPGWSVLHSSVETLDPGLLPEFDVLSGGVPCQPFSVQGERAGSRDPRDLFPQVLRLAREVRPRALVIENVLGLSETVHDGYRRRVTGRLESFGYTAFWNEVDAQDFGVPQRRRRLLLVAFREAAAAAAFRWPTGSRRMTVGAALLPMMAANGWRTAPEWAASASGVAPTLIGAGRKVGIDLGSQTGRSAFRRLGIDPGYVGREAPGPEFSGAPRLTLGMIARLQDFPDDWRFAGRSRSVFRQIVNAFPRSAAQAVAEAVRLALEEGLSTSSVWPGSHSADPMHRLSLAS